MLTIDFPFALRIAALWVIVACFAISFAYKVIGVSLAASGMLLPLISAVLMPTSSNTVVAFAVGATRLVARRVLGAP